MQGYKYETKGDNNKESDLLLVDESQVVGKVVTIYHILAIHQSFPISNHPIYNKVY